MVNTRKQEEDLTKYIQMAALAETLQVNSLTVNKNHPRVVVSKMNAKQREMIRRRQNFEEFRQIYQIKLKQESTFKKKNVISSEELSEANTQYLLKRFGIETVDKNAQNLEERTLHKPILIRKPLQTVKIQVPFNPFDPFDARYASHMHGEGEPVTQPERKSSKNSVKKEKVAEKKTITFGKPTTVEESTQADFMKELNEANRQIRVATTQLEELQKILGKNYSAETNFEEQQQQQQQQQIIQLQLQQQQKKEKTENKPKPLTKIFSHNKNKVVVKPTQKSKYYNTLKHLNQRLQKMQEKLFSRPRPRYKSINDFSVIEPDSKDVELLYGNSKYTNNESQKSFHAYMDFQTEFDDLSNNPKENNAYDATKILTSVTTTTTDIKPEANRKVSWKLAENHNSDFEYHSTYNTNKNTSPSPVTLNIIYAPKSKDYKMSDINLLPEVSVGISRRSIEDEEHFISEDNSNPIVNEVFNPNLQKTIIKSDYLMKEFKINPKDLLIESVSKQSVGANSSLHLYQSKSFNRKSSHESEYLDYEDRRIYETLNTALKNSIYSSFE